MQNNEAQRRVVTDVNTPLTPEVIELLNGYTVDSLIPLILSMKNENGALKSENDALKKKLAAASEPKILDRTL